MIRSPACRRRTSRKFAAAQGKSPDAKRSQAAKKGWAAKGHVAPTDTQEGLEPSRGRKWVKVPADILEAIGGLA